MKVKVTLRYKGECRLYQYDHEDEYADNIPFIWLEGNYACDCNRGMFFAEVKGEPDPDLPCGNMVQLISIVYDS